MTTMDSLKATTAKTAASLRSVNWKEMLTAPLILAYLVTGILSVVVPVSQWTANKNAYYKAAGYYVEYENQQREYEEAQNGNNNNNNNNNGYYSYKDCAWWNVSCRKQQYQYASYNQDNNNQYQQQIPNWYVMLGGQTEEMRRWEGKSFLCGLIRLQVEKHSCKICVGCCIMCVTFCQHKLYDIYAHLPFR